MALLCMGWDSIQKALAEFSPFSNLSPGLDMRVRKQSLKLREVEWVLFWTRKREHKKQRSTAEQNKKQAMKWSITYIEKNSNPFEWLTYLFNGTLMVSSLVWSFSANLNFPRLCFTNLLEKLLSNCLKKVTAQWMRESNHQNWNLASANYWLHVLGQVI